MIKHILLCFLSDMKLTGEPSPKISSVNYKNIGEPKECHATNESAVRYLFCDNAVNELSQLFLVRSKKVCGKIKYKADVSSNYDEKDDKGVCWKWYRDEKGNSLTHYDYFLNRIKDIVPQAEAIADPIEFDEDAPAAENMTALIEVANRVRDYVQGIRTKEPDAEFCLHVDCTGGLRNASMILVALMRLLQYEGISIGKILYSNFSAHCVEEVGALYSFFDLVAGAEEFVRHGEVSVLKRYFEKKEKSSALDRLIQAMERFAQELALCHSGELPKAIDKLREAIEAFSEAASKKGSEGAAEQNDSLMRQMLARIREDYKELLTNPDNESVSVREIAIIRWCLRHGLLQQAMTFFTERVPEMLYHAEFLKAAPRYEKEVQKKWEKDSMKRPKGFYLLNEYRKPKGSEAEEMKKCQKAWCSRYKDFLDKLKKGVTEEEIDAFIKNPFPADAAFRLKDKEKLRALLHGFWGLLHSVPGERFRERPEGQAVLNAICPFYLNHQAPQQQGKASEPTPEENEVWKALLAHEDRDIGKILLNFLRNNLKAEEMNQLGFALVLPRGVEKLREGVIVPPEGKVAVATDILNWYFAIKDERNHTNHARLESGRRAAEDLQREMEKALTEIERVCQRGGVHGGGVC